MKIPENHQCTACRRLLLSEASHFANSRSEPLCGECHRRRYPGGKEEKQAQLEADARMALARAFEQLEGVRQFRPELELEVQTIQAAMIRLRRSLDARAKLTRAGGAK
jgi:hypothetical protein